MNTKRWVALGIFVVLLFFSLFGQFSSQDFMEDNEWTETTYKQGGGEIIALLKVEGAIMDQPAGDAMNPVTYNHKLFIKQLEHAFKDNSVKGIVLEVNSPGGGVAESDEIFHKIMSLKKKYKKPIVTYMSNMAASGGYYISAATDKIYANGSTITGSIGVIIQSYNVKELADEWGIKDQTFTSGPHKDIMSPLKEMSKEESEIMQVLVDEMYQQFVDVIVEGREMDREKLLKLADGRIYSGKQAKENGLVDELGFLDDAIAGASKLAKVDDPTVIQYENELSFFNSLFGVLNRSNVDFLNMKDMVFNRPNTPSLMYLYTW